MTSFVRCLDCPPKLDHDKMSKTSTDRWLSVDEVADYLGIKRDTVYKWINRRKMPAHKVGTLWKFRKEQIDEWITSGQSAEQKRASKPR